jgi:nicotinamide-nucleotide amidase
VERGGQQRVIYAVPGVPREMKAMVTEAIVPDLMARAGEVATIYSRTLRTWGESESGLAERLAGRIAVLDGSGNPTLAYNASGIEGIKLRLTAKGPDLASAEALVDEEERELRAILGDLVFGVDEQTIEASVLSLLAERGMTLGLAESLTGGMMGSRVADVPGASAVFRGSIVSYASDVKFDVLGLPEGPVVSLDAAAAMAAGARRVLGADVGIGVTGVAGPDEQEGQPVGTVFVGLDLGPLGGDAGPEAFHVPLFGDRLQIRQFAVITAMNALRLKLLASSRSPDPFG